ncbi:hypothetical protein CGCA056_v001526 [Colletotrichum aenigma]|uniref:uncharacterized protein n=1 Tax=Colletotrichum aenigma TaxID=1215731 RepID=UPI001873075D|nr:uncharacterized protein CGCA056_v001526 [Colletotrichum aenigma]KAF5527166.1 hypothetical protein CGCA056_v001526 [Colletotrichum aenigma]
MANASDAPATASAPQEHPLGNLGAMLEWRYDHVWTLYERKDYEEAEADAMKLLMEPRLGDFHRAGMHLLLAGSPHEYVDHAKQAVRLYSQILEKNHFNMSPKQQMAIQNLVNKSQAALEKARADQSAITREVRKALASGKTYDDLRNAQMKELQDRELELAGAFGPEDGKDDNKDDGENTVTQGTQIPPASQISVSDVSASQSTSVARSQSTAPTEVDMELPEMMDEDSPPALWASQHGVGDRFRSSGCVAVWTARLQAGGQSAERKVMYLFCLYGVGNRSNVLTPCLLPQRTFGGWVPMRDRLSAAIAGRAYSRDQPPACASVENSMVRLRENPLLKLWIRGKG